jgi:hypothetical protein
MVASPQTTSKTNKTFRLHNYLNVSIFGCFLWKNFFSPKNINSTDLSEKLRMAQGRPGRVGGQGK